MYSVPGILLHIDTLNADMVLGNADRVEWNGLQLSHCNLPSGPVLSSRSILALICHPDSGLPNQENYNNMNK
jgi:hypothetical protein